MNTLRRITLSASLLAAAFMTVGCTRANPRDIRESITVDGRERTYNLHVPPSYNGSKPVPLVLALHGHLGTGEGQERLGHMDQTSDEHGFIIAYPDGLDRSWADGRGASPSDKNGVNDVKFLSGLIVRLERQYKIDPGRVYATGMSNGGFMSGRLACDLSDRIVAVGIVAASLSTSTAAACHPAKPVSVLIMQGTKDPLVPYDGGALGKNGDRGEVLSHDAAVRKFGAVNHCSDNASRKHIPDTANDGTSVDLFIYSGCSAGTEVHGYTINDGGHAWPGGVQYLPQMVIGKTSHNLNASETIWEFFSAHSR